MFYHNPYKTHLRPGLDKLNLPVKFYGYFTAFYGYFTAVLRLRFFYQVFIYQVTIDLPGKYCVHYAQIEYT